MRRLGLGVLLSMSVACAGGPTTPTPPATPKPPAPSTYTLSGIAIATNGGQPLAGATVSIEGNTTTTDANGRYALTLALGLSATPPFTISGPGLVTHAGVVRGRETRTVDLDAIRLDGQFDPAFYRMFTHDALDYPAMYALKRWTQAPKIYVQTVDDAGKPVEPRTLAATLKALSEAIGPLTGGHFGFDAIEQGAADRTEPGWITVRWFVDTSTQVCGRAFVGNNPGSIDLYYKKVNCTCEGVSQIRPMTIKHELGHALGYWHTDKLQDLMYGQSPKPGCDQDLAVRERYHAAIAYSRPVGNTDPDNDPTDATSMRPLTAIAIP